MERIIERVEYVLHYCQESDMTFTTKETYKNNDLISVECVGFVFGQTEIPATNLKAEF